MLICVVNISEGRNGALVGEIADAAGTALLDVHTDPDHNRAVLTLVGEEAPRTVTRSAVARLDLGGHDGVHPRIGVVDVVPFVPIGAHTLRQALDARDTFAAWAGAELDLPCFLYGPERTLPHVRRHAFVDLEPDVGPSAPHPTAGAASVGARNPLVAYNLWLADAEVHEARQIAASLRGPAVRALGLRLGDQVQISTNLVAPLTFGPADVYDLVKKVAAIDRAELVGLIGRDVLEGIAEERWAELDLADRQTIEARISARGLDRDV